MPFGRRTRRTPHTTAPRATTTRPTLMQRLRGRHGKCQGPTPLRLQRNTNRHPATARTTPRTTRKTRHTPTTTTTTTTTTTKQVQTAHGGPAHQHHRRPSTGDKIAGAMMKLRGSLTRKSGVKGAGTKRMHGTDGRGSHRY